MIRIPRRTRTRVVAGLAVGALLAIGAPLAASAHVEVDPTTAPAGATTPLTFSFAHGCDGSPTRSLTITVPKGVGNVTPVVEGGWGIHRTLGPDGTPTTVVFTAATPVEQGLAASVSMNVLFDTSARGTRVAFPVVQTCVKGSTSWTQIPTAGQDPESLDTPAPAVQVGQPGATEDAEKAAPDAAPSGATVTPAPNAASPATATATADPVARWLGAGGLASGVAALVIAVVSAVRRAPSRR